MNDKADPNAPAPPALRNVMIVLVALLGFAAAVLAITALPLADEWAIALAYFVVFAIAAVSIALIFRVFVKRP